MKPRLISENVFRGTCPRLNRQMNGIRRKLGLLICRVVVVLFAAGSSVVANEANSPNEYECVVSCDGGIAGLLAGAGLDRRLDSVELLMADAPSPEGGFRVSLHCNTADGLPGEKVAELEGSGNPENTGKYSYRAKEPVLLAANEDYWLVARVHSPGSAYRLQALSASNEGGGSFEAFTEFHVLGNKEQAVTSIPAISPQILPITGGARGSHPSHHKTIWTVVLSGVILLCCADLFPRPGFFH